AALLDPAEVLKEWRASERRALLSRGLFAPATFGALRMQHRGFQEFLTASWFDRLLQAGLPLSALFDLCLAAPHGVRTIAPSLRAPLAWLAAKSRSVREALLEREPAALLAFGDSSHLTLEEKERVLCAFAERDAVGASV